MGICKSRAQHNQQKTLQAKVNLLIEPDASEYLAVVIAGPTGPRPKALLTGAETVVI